MCQGSRLKLDYRNLDFLSNSSWNKDRKIENIQYISSIHNMVLRLDFSGNPPIYGGLS